MSKPTFYYCCWWWHACSKSIPICTKCFHGYSVNNNFVITILSILDCMYSLLRCDTNYPVFVGATTDKLTSLVSNLISSRGTAWLTASSKLAMSAIYLHHIKVFIRNNSKISSFIIQCLY